MRSKYTLLYIGATLLVMVLTACDRHTVYHHFEHLPNDGWDRSDTLYFEVPTIETDGNYHISLDMRTNSSYPYQNLSVVVEQTVLPTALTRRDTVNCLLMDEQGSYKGTGISQFQYSFPLPLQHLRKDQALRLAVFHIMRLEVLPGVSDVGIRVYDNKKELKTKTI